VALPIPLLLHDFGKLPCLPRLSTFIRSLGEKSLRGARERADGATALLTPNRLIKVSIPISIDTPYTYPTFIQRLTDQPH
jgi:hypothetical protein